MTRRLTLLNAALLILLAVSGRMIWKQAHDASEAQGLLRAPVGKTEFSLPKPPVAFSPLKASSYLGIAEGNLLSPDRNATIVLEAPPAKPLPAPPPAPPLPLLSGVILMAGSPPTVLLSTRSGPGRRAYHTGDSIGDWQIDSFDREQIVLRWQGNKVTKRLAELMDRVTITAQTLSPPKNQNAPTSPIQPPVGN
jgi:hypothetical protein